MKFFNQKKAKDVAFLAVAVMAIQVVLSKWVYPLFNSGTQQLFSITPQTVLGSPTIGNKVIAFLSGIIPFELATLTNWLAIFIGAFVMLIAGYWIYEQKWVPWKGKNVYQRIWAILLYGTAVLYAVLLLLKVEVVSILAVPLLIGLAVNYFVIAFVVSQLAQRIKILRI